MNTLKGIAFAALSVAVVATSGCFSRRENAPASTPAAAPANGKVIITPAASPAGRVASVNAQGHFVVLSFPVGQVPPDGTRLNVYRAGMKVGELKVTLPQDDILTAADITAGTAQEKDEARAD